jgi:thymidine kinase
MKFNLYNENMTSGYLELFIGPMFSGKTSKLIQIYKELKGYSKTVSVINHSFDKRYDDLMMSSHDKIMVPCLQAKTLGELWNNTENNGNNVLRSSDFILINEGQFFEDIYDIVLDMLKHNKTVYVCGLDGDFERKKFGLILDLIPICDKVTKLNSLCVSCKDNTPGIFSKRITGETGQTVIGSDNYIAVCRSCYGT